MIHDPGTYCSWMCLSNGDVHYPMAPPSDSLAEFEESCHIVTGWIWLVGIEHTCTKQSALWKDLLQKNYNPLVKEMTAIRKVSYHGCLPLMWPWLLVCDQLGRYSKTRPAKETHTHKHTRLTQHHPSQWFFPSQGFRSKSLPTRKDRTITKTFKTAWEGHSLQALIKCSAQTQDQKTAWQDDSTRSRLWLNIRPNVSVWRLLGSVTLSRLWLKL